jgi:hypothetical protein
LRPIEAGYSPRLRLGAGDARARRATGTFSIFSTIRKEIKMPIDDKLIDDIADLAFSKAQKEKLIRYLSAKKDDDGIAAPEMATLTGAISAAESASIDRKRIPALNEIKARLRRFGYDLKDNEIVDPFKLDQCFAGRDVQERLALKVSMRACGLLPKVA